MTEQYPDAVCVAWNYLEDRGWSELIDPRWAPELLEEFRRSGLGWTDEEIVNVVNEVLFGRAEWDSKDRLNLSTDMWPTRQEQINTSIKYNGFSEHTLQLIDNLTNDILNGRTDLDRFNQSEHARVRTRATCYGAQTSICHTRGRNKTSRDALKSKARVANQPA